MPDVKLGQSDVEVLQGLVMKEGERCMKRAKKAKRSGDDAARRAHVHMAEHLAKIHMRLDGGVRERITNALKDMVERLGGGSVTMVSPGDPGYEEMREVARKRDEHADKTESVEPAEV